MQPKEENSYGYHLKFNTKRSPRHFTAINCGNDGIITPIRDESGRMEYEVSRHGHVIAIAQSSHDAQEHCVLTPYAKFSWNVL